jgi:hypothetical protein
MPPFETLRASEQAVLLRVARASSHTTKGDVHMTKTKSTKITLNLDKRFDALIQRVATWNTGAYKTANDQLYDLLADT